MFKRSCSSESLNRYESVVFLIFPGKRPFKLCPSTSLRQFDWERSRYSSRDLAVDPCQGIENILQSSEHHLPQNGSCSCLVNGVTLESERRDDGLFLTTKAPQSHIRMTRNWRPDVHVAPGYFYVPFPSSRTAVQISADF